MLTLLGLCLDDLRAVRAFLLVVITQQLLDRHVYSVGKIIILERMVAYRVYTGKVVEFNQKISRPFTVFAVCGIIQDQ